MAGAVALGMAAPAQAAESSAATPATVQSSAPNCVDAYTSHGTVTETLHISNNCDYTVRVKGVLALHTDTPCRTYSPGAGYKYTYARSASFSGLENC
ncbi:MAG: hypothetical protein ACRDQ5_16940 [Sciscionella sp.]